MIKFVEYDSKAIENQLISAYEEATGETLYPGDERRLFLLNLLPVIVSIKSEINDTGRQNLLRYARGQGLDGLGELYDTDRLLAKKSLVTMLFILSAPQQNTITIPVGTRVTPDGVLYFATIANLIIPASQTSGTITAEAIEVGQAYNGFAPGQIKTIVDPIPFVASCENTTTSQGGTDVESDGDYRERIRLAPRSISVAGPEGAYKFWARSADESIADIAVYSPAPNTVNITVLLNNGEIPGQPILDRVLAEVSPRNRRPLTDLVQVEAATAVPFTADVTYYISVDNQTEESNIRASIENDGGAVDQYLLWQKSKLKRAINPDELRRRLLSAGAVRIEIAGVSYTEIEINEVAIGTIDLTYGGLI